MATIQHGILAGNSYREGQEQALEFIANSSKRFIALNAPTGSGKSIVGFDGMTSPFFYLCSSIHLEHQLQNDFPEAALLKGKSNYHCPVFESADLCMLKKRCYDCEYERAKINALANDHAILNYHYFLYAFNYTSIRKKKVRNIVCDEADQLEGIVTGFISFNFMFKSLNRLGILKRKPDKKTKIQTFIPWLEELFYAAHRQMMIMKPQIEAMEDQKYYSAEDNRFIRKYNQTEHVRNKAAFLKSQDLTDETWVYYSSDEFVQCKPLWLTRDLSDTFLFDYGGKFLFMSATLPAKEVLCNLYGLGIDEVDYLELPHPFPAENRPIIYRPAYSLTKKEEVSDDLVREKVDDILKVENGRGVIHTSSYKIAQRLVGLSERLIFHNSEDKDERFKEFLASDDGVWVSPSSIRGIDLHDDLARWCIILKCLYLDLGDYHTSQRLYASGKWGQLWYTAQAIDNIIQACGRIVRHEKDWGRAYILDRQVGRLLERNTKLWPYWFREAVVYE